MAMILSTDAVNKLLASILEQDPLRIPDQDLGLLTVRVEPELPTIQIASVQGCPGCVLSNWRFSVQVDLGLDVINGSASAALALPVGLTDVSGAETGLIASMDEATFLDLEVSVGGLSTSQVGLVDELIREEATRLLRNELGAVELSRFDAWQLGDDELLLKARGPFIFPEEGTMVLGLHTNLALPPTATVVEQATLPEGSEMGIQLHPELMLTVMQRMLNVGVIPRESDANGQADRRGDHQVTLEAMSSSDASDGLKTSFRVWRTGGGLCGFADVSSDLSMRINGDFVQLEADNFDVEGGEGIGALLTDSSETWLASDFMQSLTENLALTINYRDFGSEEEEGNLEPRTTELVVDGRGLSVFLNLGD
jgi:hypothetical protein